jgi:hypothetical protein
MTGMILAAAGHNTMGRGHLRSLLIAKRTEGQRTTATNAIINSWDRGGSRSTATIERGGHTV